MFKRSREDIGAVMKNDPAAPKAFVIYFTYPGVIALRRHRRAHFWYKKGFKSYAIWLSYRTRKKTGIDIHPQARIGKRVFIDHGMGVVIGQTSVVGNDVTIYQGVTLGAQTLEKIDRHPIIEDHVVIYAQATIVGKITVGAHSIIGAGSFVNKDLEPYSKVIGAKSMVTSLIK